MASTLPTEKMLCLSQGLFYIYIFLFIEDISHYMCYRKLYKTTAVLKYWYAGQGEPRLPTVSMNKNMYESALRMLLLESDGNIDKSVLQVSQKCGI